MSLDPIDYAVISQALLAAAREMGTKLVRSAYSTIVREARDASAAILDREGNVVAQAELIPMQLGSMSATFLPCIAAHPVETLAEGDFLINNHPYHGGQHLQDVYVFSPIFFEGNVVGFAASVAHHVDIGGGRPGLNMDATDLYQEGLIIPPIRINEKRDWNGGPFEQMVAANCRVPWQTVGDIYAQLAGNAIGSHRVTELARKYGSDTLTAAMAELIAYSERRLRAAIALIPDGVYIGEDAIDDDGIGTDPVAIKVRLEVSGEDVAIDFTGTAPQVRTNLNSPLSSTISAAYSAVKMALSSPDIPFNEGTKKPLRIVVPEGSVLNPRAPAPVRARIEVCYAAFNAIMKALAEAVPDRVTAPGFDRGVINCLSRLGGDGYRVYIEVFSGGFGAGRRNDGCSAVDGVLSNCSNTPVETLDMEFDFFRVVEYSLRPGSGGKGRFTGGLGLVRRYEVLEDDVEFALYADRFRAGAEGVGGGEAALPAAVTVERGGQRITVRSKDSLRLQKGDVLVLETGGGGGYGSPDERDAASLLRDEEDGLTGPGLEQDRSGDMRRYA
jgi:N-methylhydantoinase B